MLSDTDAATEKFSTVKKKSIDQNEISQQLDWLGLIASILSDGRC
jgi:hypothetical protein